MADGLIAALRSDDPAAVQLAMRADPEAALKPRIVVEAARLAFQTALKLLINAGADLNASYRGYRALHALMQEDPHAAGARPDASRLRCLDWLLAHGADPDLPGAWPPARAIVIAAFVGQQEYIDRLEKSGARIDGFASAALADATAVKAALKTSPDFVHSRDTGGLTALQCAAGSRIAPTAAAAHIARMLIAAGADPLARTPSWDREIDACFLAAQTGNRKLFEMLLDHGADPDEALTHAVWSGKEKLADLAIARGAAPDRAVAEGQPLLNNLIRWGQVKGALWLLAKGANPNLPDSRGWTAVHQAVSRGNVRMLQAVEQAGGDLACLNNEGQTPADLVRK